MSQNSYNIYDKFFSAEELVSKEVLRKQANLETVKDEIKNKVNTIYLLLFLHVVLYVTSFFSFIMLMKKENLNFAAKLLLIGLILLLSKIAIHSISLLVKKMFVFRDITKYEPQKEEINKLIKELNQLLLNEKGSFDEGNEKNFQMSLREQQTLEKYLFLENCMTTLDENFSAERAKSKIAKRLAIDYRYKMALDTKNVQTEKDEVKLQIEFY